MADHTEEDRETLDRIASSVRRMVLSLQKLEDLTTEGLARGSDQSHTCSSKSTGGCCIQSYGSLTAPGTPTG